MFFLAQTYISLAFTSPQNQDASHAMKQGWALQVWARAQGLQGEPDGINGAVLSLLAAHLAASGALVRSAACLLSYKACGLADLGSPGLL